MQRKRIIIAGGIIAAAAAWYAFRPERLFINDVVNESFAAGAAADSMAMMASKPDLMVTEAMPSGAPRALAAGSFRGIAHETKGAATIYTVGEKRVLRLTQFATSNGPDVHVYLVAARDAGDNETVTRAGFVDLGSLKGNIGDQNYDVPADIDLSKYQAVTIWCKRFGVNFGTAPLASQS